MNRQLWYCFHIDTWRRHTRHLSFAEKGAYRELIDEYMNARGPLPDNDRALAAIAGGDLADWQLVQANVRAFFKIKDGKLYHQRCDDELRKQTEQFNKRSTLGRHAVSFARHVRGLRTERSTDVERKSTKIELNITSTSLTAATPPVDSVDNFTGRPLTAKGPGAMNGAGPSRELIEIASRKGWIPSPNHRPKS